MLLSRPNDGLNTALSVNHSQWRHHSTLSTEGVIADANSRLQRNPRDPHALQRRGRARMRLGDPRGAFTDLSTLIDVIHGDSAVGVVAQAFFFRGLCQQKLTHIDEAIADFTAALDADPSHKRAAYERAACHNRKGNFTAAILDYERALQSDVGRSNFLLYRNARSRFAKMRLQQYGNASPLRGSVRNGTTTSSAGPTTYTSTSTNNTSNNNNNHHHRLEHQEGNSSRQNYSEIAKKMQSERKAAPAELPTLTKTTYRETQKTSAGMTSSTCNEDVAERHHQRGLEYRKQGDFVRAIEEYTAAIQLDPKNFKALFNRGFCRDKIGDYDAAIRDYQAALEVEPGYAYTYYNLGISLDRKGNRFDEAIAMFDKAILLDGSNPDFYHNRGFSRRKMGHYREAVKDYTTAISLDPKHFKAYYNRAFCYDKLGEITSAVEDYSNAITIQSDNPNAYHNRGAALEKIGRLAEAAEDYSQAIALDGGNPYTYNARGVTYSRLNKYDAALKDLSKAISLSPNNVSFFQNRGSLYQTMELFAEALQDCDSALKLNAQDAESFNKPLDDGKRETEASITTVRTYNNRGFCHARLGHYEAATRDFSEVLARDAAHLLARHNRGICYDKLGHHAKAVADFTHLIEQDPNSPDAYMSRGAALERMCNYTAALDDYTAALALDVDQCGLKDAVAVAKFKDRHPAAEASKRVLQLVSVRH